MAVGWCAVVLGERGRNRLGIVLVSLHSLLALAGLALVLAGVFVRVRLESSLVLVEGYRPGPLPNLLFSVGGLTALFGVVGSLLCFTCAFWSSRQRWEIGFQYSLDIYLLLLFLFTWVTLAAGCVTQKHKNKLADAFESGLLQTMARYADAGEVKETLDRLQMTYKCCGSARHTDWFNMPWMNLHFVDTDNPKVKSMMKDGKLITDSVPFSCCDPASTRPCIHHHVTSTSLHRNYNPANNTTLFNSGCAETLSESLHKTLLGPIAKYIFWILLAQWIIIFLVRYLQTSVYNAYVRGTPDGLAPGFLCRSLFCSIEADLDPYESEKKLASEQNLENDASQPLLQDEDGNFDPETGAATTEVTAPLAELAGTYSVSELTGWDLNTAAHRKTQPRVISPHMPHVETQQYMHNVDNLEGHAPTYGVPGYHPTSAQIQHAENTTGNSMQPGPPGNNAMGIPPTLQGAISLAQRVTGQSPGQILDNLLHLGGTEQSPHQASLDRAESAMRSRIMYIRSRVKLASTSSSELEDNGQDTGDVGESTMERFMDGLGKLGSMGQGKDDDDDGGGGGGGGDSDGGGGGKEDKGHDDSKKGNKEEKKDQKKKEKEMKDKKDKEKKDKDKDKKGKKDKKKDKDKKEKKDKKKDKDKKEKKDKKKDKDKEKKDKKRDKETKDKKGKDKTGKGKKEKEAGKKNTKKSKAEKGKAQKSGKAKGGKAGSASKKKKGKTSKKGKNPKGAKPKAKTKTKATKAKKKRGKPKRPAKAKKRGKPKASKRARGGRSKRRRGGGGGRGKGRGRGKRR